MRLSFNSNSFVAAVGVLVFAGATAFLAMQSGEPPLVSDDAGLMDDRQRARITEHHAYLLQDHDIDYRIMTKGGVGDVNRFALDRYSALGVGSKSTAGRGLLLVIDPKQDVVRLEVGYALEGAFPDAFVAYIEHRQMVPFFRSGRIADGILATTELIVTRAQRAQANAGFDSEVWSSGSGGAGATAPGRIGAGPSTPSAKLAPGPGPGPADTLNAYFAAMRDRNDNPNLALYSPDTRRMLQGWVVTPAQMDTVVRTYRNCRPGQTRIEGAHAVIRYPIDQRSCAPFFFEKADGLWMLDLTMMQHAIRFGRGNSWRFNLNADHPYRFAFSDWNFDRNGFPVSGAKPQ